MSERWVQYCVHCTSTVKHVETARGGKFSDENKILFAIDSTIGVISSLKNKIGRLTPVSQEKITNS